MPALDLFAISSDPDRLDSVGGAGARAAILSAADAIERFVVAACVSLGLPQLTALAEPADGDGVLELQQDAQGQGDVGAHDARMAVRPRFRLHPRGRAFAYGAVYPRKARARGRLRPQGAARAVTKVQVTPV